MPKARTVRFACVMALFLALLPTSAALSQNIARRAHAEFSGQLPIAGGQLVTVSQGNNEADHVFEGQYTFDFIVGQQNFPITAAQTGTVIGLNDKSDIRCSDLNWESTPVNQSLLKCWTRANFVLVRNDDGATASLYMHLLKGSTCSTQFCIRVGEHVRQGQPIGRAGTSGWSSGVHLHYQTEVVPTPEPNPFSGWWFTQSVPTRFTNRDVIAQDSDGVPLKRQQFRLGATASQSPPAPSAIDWKNQQYNLTCAGTVRTPVKVGVKGGKATVTGRGLGHYSQWLLHIEQVAHGVLPSFGDVSAVLFYCSPQPSNFFVEELDVYRTADGTLIGQVPPVGTDGGILPGVFQPGSVGIANGDVSADVKFYGPGDTHASGPSVPGHVSWKWNGEKFASVAPQSPAALAPCTSQALSQVRKPSRSSGQFSRTPTCRPPSAKPTSPSYTDLLPI